MTLSHRAVNNMTMLKPHLLHALHDLQHQYRYIPEDQIEPLAQTLALPIAQIQSVIDFYSFFTRTPRGH